MQFFQDEHFSWKILIIESFVIMMSVVLGFYLTGWRQEVAQEKKLDKALESIYSEIQYNQSQVEDLLPYYQTLRDTLDYLREKKGEGASLSLIEIPGFHGFKIPLLQNSAFETAQANGVFSSVDYDLTRKIFEIYNGQQRYEKSIDQITNGLILGEFDTVWDWYIVFRILGDSGKATKYYYSELLKTMQEKYNVQVQKKISSQ